jgi:hypothetical protein
MAHAFQPIPGKPSFGNITPTQYAGDYIKNKLARITYCRNLKNRNCKKRYSQGDLLRYYQGQTLSRYGFCNGISPLNYADLTAGLYTESDLQNVAIISDVSGNLTPTTIDPCVCPFYSYYNIDPKGELFGNTFCGLNNFTSYMTLDNSNILPPPPTDLSVTLLSSLSTSTFYSPNSPNSASFMEPFTEIATCSVTFSWQPPIYNGGSLISEYVVNYYDITVPETIYADTVPSTQLYIEISNIQIPGTYIFKVASVNLTGQGPFAQIEYTSPTYPGAPTDAIATSYYFDVYFRNYIILTWTAPTFTGGGGTTISYYDISYNDGTTLYTVSNHPSTSYTIAGLNYNRTYTFQIYSVNSLELISQTAADASATTVSQIIPTNGTTEIFTLDETGTGGSFIYHWPIPNPFSSSPIDIQYVATASSYSNNDYGFYAFDSSSSVSWNSYYQTSGGDHGGYNTDVNPATYKTSGTPTKGIFTTSYDTSQTISGEWLQVDMNDSVLLYLYQFQCANPFNRAPYNFIVLGSNDQGTSWTTVDSTYLNTSTLPLYDSSGVATFIVPTSQSPHPYSSYRLAINSINNPNSPGDADIVDINQWNLFYLPN